MITFRFVEQKDIEHVAKYMRFEDKREVAKCGKEPKEILQVSVKASEFCLAAYYEGEPICIFGVAPETMLGQRHVAWLLGTEKINQCKKAYFKACKKALSMMLQKYPILCNAVDPEYEKAHKWLKALGAEFKGTKKVSTGIDFDYFEIRRK